MADPYAAKRCFAEAGAAYFLAAADVPERPSMKAGPCEGGLGAGASL